MNTRHLSQKQSASASRKLLAVLGVIVVLVGLVFGLMAMEHHRLARERVEWKTGALLRLSGLSISNENIQFELKALKESRGLGPNQEWRGQHVLLMTNNEYLVFEFKHGLNNGFVDHLFLAHGSNGRWYYSTYHFCNGMQGVVLDDPPASIAAFASKYSVREFDGKSDVCLQHTWPEGR